MAGNAYGRSAKKILHQDVRRDVDPAFKSVEAELDTIKTNAIRPIASISLLPAAASLVDGTVYYVQPQKALYQVVSGIWTRLITSSSWSTQGTWFIDPIAGNDENQGNTAPTALKTLAELRARLYSGSRAVISIPTTVTIVGTTFSEDFIFYADISSTGRLVFQGTRTIISSRVWTAFTARSKATNVPNQGTDAGGVQAANIGNMIVDTQAGVNFGASGWILKDQGASVARLTSFMKFDPAVNTLLASEVTPGATDSYQIVSLTSLTGFIDVDVQGPLALGGVGIAKFVMDSFAILGLSTCGPMLRSRSILAYLTNCSTSTSTATFHIEGFLFSNVFFASGFVGLRASVSGIPFFIQGGGTLSSSAFTDPANQVNFRNGFIFQAANLTMKGIGRLMLSDVGFFDGPSGGQIILQDGAILVLQSAASLWGSTSVAGSQAIDVQSGQCLNETSGTWVLAAPIVTNLSNLGSSGATTTAVFATDPSTGTIFAGSRSLTFTLLDTSLAGGGFAGKWSNPRAFSSYNRVDLP